MIFVFVERIIDSEAGNRTPVVRVTGGNTKPLYYFGTGGNSKQFYLSMHELNIDCIIIYYIQ